MAKKADPKALQEALKRFKLLSEYSFYTEEPKDNDDNLILGNMDEADEEPAQDPNAAPAAAPADPNAAPAAPADDSNTSANTAPPATAAPADPNAAPDFGAEAGPDAASDDANQFGGDDMGGDMDMPAEDEVDVDVTQLVDSTKDAKQAAKVASHKTSKLMQKFDELEGKLDHMATITNKIDALEKEIIKRNPTPVEKLEMRSLDSGPFNVKLSDYWKDVDGYDTGVDKKPQEYVLTKDDVDGGFLDSQIKNSFNVPDDDEYEEEDVY